MKRLFSNETEMLLESWLSGETPIIVYDYETTGLSPTDDRVIQVAAKKIWCDPNIPEEDFCQFINPERLLPEKITEITGFTDADLEDKPVESEAFMDIKEFFGNYPVVGWNNMNFDDNFSANMWERNGETFAPAYRLDAMMMAKRLIDSPNYKLITISGVYGIEVKFHDARGDVHATAMIFRILADMIREEEKDESPKLQPKIHRLNRWQGKNHKLLRLYVETNMGSIYWDLWNTGWFSGTADVRTIDLMSVEREIERITGFKSRDYNKIK